MEKFCDSCGSLVNSAETVCPLCGAELAVVSAARVGGSSARGVSSFGGHDFSGIGAAGSSKTIGTGNAAKSKRPREEAKTAPAPATETMSVGKWVATILLSCFLGPISIFLLVCWGWDSGSKEPRRSYARAALILCPLMGIIIVAGVFFLGFAVAELFIF